MAIIKASEFDPYAGLPEKAFLDRVRKHAQSHGWLEYHTYNSRKSPAGFPDLCMVRNGRLIFAELKTSKGKESCAQRLWLESLRAVPGIEVYLWRPADWPTIEAVLQRKPEPGAWGGAV